MPPTRHTPLRVAFRRPWPGTRRGFKLWLFAVVIGTRGLLYATDPATQSGAFVLPFGVSAQTWGWVVFVVCCVATFSAYCHFGRDRYGYKAMSTLATLWAFMYAYGYVFNEASKAAMQGVLSMLLILVLLIHCAGDPELPLERP